MTLLSVAKARLAESAGQERRVQGWVRTRRDSKGGFSFLELNDGSCFGNVQVVADGSAAQLRERDQEARASAAASPSRAKSASRRPRARRPRSRRRKVVVHGWADPETYPLQKKGHTFEFLRTIAHLRPRTNTFGAIARVRNCVSRSIHDFFQEQGFLYIHTPIITASDCEGAGRDVPASPRSTCAKPPLHRRQGRLHARTSSASRPTSPSAASCRRRSSPARWARSTRSARRSARRTRTRSRHLAEFWMVEPEMAFFDLNDNMTLAEAFLKRIFSDVLEQLRRGHAVLPGAHRQGRARHARRHPQDASSCGCRTPRRSTSC